jgi:hypothetical protein
MPLAGQMGFDAPFCSEAEAVIPPAAAFAIEFRPRADINRPSQPRLSDLTSYTKAVTWKNCKQNRAE